MDTFRVLRLVLFRWWLFALCLIRFEAMETLLIHSPHFFEKLTFLVRTNLYLLRINPMNYLDRLPCPLLVHQ
ncbi:hypothetical protein K435DRAFT_778115 [Dendrothele bispora CBS 962.96]|uniref:Uncharacterized protein n=1 Tax=Dendrothele bispora (strain CBS 962.96) TaxID=1314807 RepID=A0A4S8M6C2_DENBC|nr:hypothetical protein K435DRAFT_778115 [Dendrothele bispora CBS 962.96]